LTALLIKYLNVLIDNLAFVEDLSQVALGETNGSMLYIPYVVIKELDRLKDRRNEDSLKRCAAIRAIRYLNDKFDVSLKIQGELNKVKVKLKQTLDFYSFNISTISAGGGRSFD